MDISRILRRAGWLLFVLMWVPFMTAFFGMIGIPSGEYDWVELPVLTRYSLILVAVLGASAMILRLGAPLVSWLINRTVLTRGVHAEATVINLSDTGTTINNNPVMSLSLEVHPPGGSPFQAETERLVSRLQIPQIQPGMVVKVKYDPSSKAIALVDEFNPEANS